MILGLTKADLDNLTGALCHDPKEDPEAWFPVSVGGGTPNDWETPRGKCLECPALHACELWALSEPDPTNGEGMWGALSPDERAQLRKASA